MLEAHYGERPDGTFTVVVPTRSPREALEQEPRGVVGTHRDDDQQQHEPPHGTRVGRPW